MVKIMMLIQPMYGYIPSTKIIGKIQNETIQLFQYDLSLKTIFHSAEYYAYVDNYNFFKCWIKILPDIFKWFWICHPLR